jgi:16S rRNA (cytidine1402-2'-O)-methyltransferase
MTTTTSPGILYLVATPIGNREDISFRALATLKQVDFILAEDTRHTSPFLAHFGIQKPLIALHAHNEAQQSEEMLLRLLAGEHAALVSDAGTPLISDPGFVLVRMAREKGVQVVPIPGACALIAALSASGVPADAFTFVGFLPAKSCARLKKLEAYTKLPHTLVLYESTHRIEACIEAIGEICGPDYLFVLAKELTKTHECFRSGNASMLNHWLQEDKARIKGEFVLILPPRSVEEKDEMSHHLRILLKELPLKQAVKLTIALTGKQKNEVYERALMIQQKENV